MTNRPSSESEDSDDPFSWIVQRKQIKGDLESQTWSSIVGNQQSNRRHNLHHSHRSPTCSSESPSSPNTKQVSEPIVLKASSEHIQGGPDGVHRDVLSSAQERGVLQPHPHVQVNKPQINKPQVVDKTNVHKGATKSEGLAQDRKLGANVHTETNGFGRQRSTDSLTLSSSPSEGETPTSSEGTSQSEDQRTKVADIKDDGSSKPTLSSGKTKKSSKKQSKKSKKSQKKDRGQGAQHSSTPAEQQAKNKKMSKRRAYVLERIRSDSLTSSDEEHCLGSSEMSSSTDSGMNSLLHQDSILEDGDSAVVDIEKLKLHLQRRILAKKPPVLFETPSTHHLFHEVSLVYDV